MANTKKISKEEEWMGFYFEELKEAGFIKNIEYQPEPIILFNEVKVPVHKQLKTKVREDLKTLLSERVYTMDYLITWNGRNAFHEPISNDYYEEFLPIFLSDMNRSCIEVKSDTRFDNNMTRLFTSRTQPWIWDKFQIYINHIKVPEIFRKTFIPKKILSEFFYKRDVYVGKGKKRKLKALKESPKFNWEYKTLKEFLDGY
jgi:hypothetical protein